MRIGWLEIGCPKPFTGVMCEAPNCTKQATVAVDVSGPKLTEAFTVKRCREHMMDELASFRELANTLIAEMPKE